MKQPTNQELAELLRRMAAAYQILDENRFKIIAYERAADSIEHLTSEVKDLWDDGKLGEIPGVGSSIAGYLDELFQAGKVEHFDQVMKRLPAAVFPLLSVPGIGPKKAYKLVSELRIRDDEEDVIGELEFNAKAHKIAQIEGFGEKSEQDILEAIASFKKGQIKEKRMGLPIADSIAQDVMKFLNSLSAAERVDALGSLRRQVSTIGDIDIAVATKKPKEIIEKFLQYPHQKIIERGPTGASLLLHSGRQADLRVQEPGKYGAMLQYFTGSKNHNIKLREHGLDIGVSLNEYGIKIINKRKYQISNIKYQIYISKVKKCKDRETVETKTEEEFYGTLGMEVIPPELREDKGEIEVALAGKLPKVVELGDIKGDLHIHTDYDLKPSHDLGADPLEKYLEEASKLGYEYVGLSDHNPKTSDLSEQQIVSIMKKRKAFYEAKAKNKKVKIFVMCEVDIQPDGKLALPKEAFEFVDAVIVSIHSIFSQPKAVMTKRVVSALTAHPKVRIFGHPTGRLLAKREGVELDWKEIFAVCKEKDIALEINAYPDRLDLPDTIVYDAVKAGIKLCINTDAHAVYKMDVMKYGVSVARRGWAEKSDIVNSMVYDEFRRWLL